MPDDGPQPPKNPFIRFKQHVDARIGSGLSLLTGGPGADRGSTAQPDSFPMQRSSPSFKGAETPCSASNPPSRADAMALDASNHDFRTTTEYWNDWAQFSPYSPYNLRHLPQPIPNDLPVDVAVDHGHLFGFEDALEDLLAATSGQPLMDLRKHAEYKRVVARAFRYGEEPTLFWANRLVGRGLLQRPLPVPDPDLASKHPLVATSTSGEQAEAQPAESVEQWLNERRRRAAEMDLQAEAGRLQELVEEWRNGMIKQFDRDVTFNPADIVRHMEQVAQEIKKEVYRADLEEWKNEAIKKLDKEVTFNPADTLRKVEQMAEDFRKEISDFFDIDAFLGVNDDKAPEKKQQPTSDYDLFSAIESAVAEADRSFSKFVKAITDSARKDGDSETSWPPARWTRAPTEEPQQEPQQTEVVEHDGARGSTIKSTTQHVDMFGYVHQKTEIRTLDKDGNEVSRESRYSVHPSPEKEKQAATQAARIESPDVVRQDEKDKASGTAGTAGKSSGWFWR